MAGDPDTSVAFDGGNGFVDTSYSPNDTSFTIEAWIRPLSYVAPPQRNIAGVSGGPAQLLFNVFDQSTQTYLPGHAGILSFNGTSFYGAYTQQALPLNQWSYLVGTWDNSSKDMRIFVNGALDSAQYFGNATPTHFGPSPFFQIGGFNETLHGGPYSDQYIQGGIDEVAYYSYALTATQVQQHYKAATESTDIEMLSAKFQDGNTVQFSYQTTGDPGAFDVGLYRSVDGGKVYDQADLIGSLKSITPGSPNFQGSDTLPLPNPLAYVAAKPFLVVVANPLHQVDESDKADDQNNVAIIPADRLAWGGGKDGSGFDESYSNEFNQKVVAIAKELQISDPNWLMTAMAFETNGTFSPSFQDGSGVGLLQFQPPTAKLLHTTIEQLQSMTALQQLDYVKLYLSPYIGRLNTVGDIEMAVLWPLAIGQPDPDTYVIFDSTSTGPKNTRGAYYNNNPDYFDINHDGKITEAEVVQRVIETLNKGLGSSYVGYYFDT